MYICLETRPSSFVRIRAFNVYPLYSRVTADDAIKGSSPAPAGFSTLGAASQAFRIPCNSQFSFGFNVGSQTFVLNPDSLVIQLSDGTCVSGIEGLTDSSQTNYIVGARFISTIYL